MKRLLSSLIIVFFCLSQLILATTEGKNKEYILEFPTNLGIKSFLKDIDSDQYEIRYTFDSDLFNGISIQFKNQHIASHFIKQNSHNILNSWPIHYRTKIHAPVQPTFTNTFFTLQDKDTLGLFTPSNQFKELTAKGEGIKIGIIDTGVDYRHPALGGCFGKGCKVAYGYDLVGNNFDGSINSIKQSQDPIDNCPINSTSATGHGTFISGIIAADDKVYNWTGVAPEATLGMWKVYGCNYGSSPSDILLKAMEMAYKAGMDIINISLGVSGGWEEDVLSVMADRLVSNGIHVVAASGNSGTSGVFLIASPASGKDVIAAGSTSNDYVPGYILKVYNKDNNAVNDIYYRTFVNSPLVLNSVNDIVATGDKFNQTNDACSELKDSYNSSIVLIHQGDCDSLIKVKNAKEAGAIAVILYTDIPGNIEILSSAVLPVAFIDSDDGKYLFDNNVQGQFTNILVELKSTNAGMVSGYSTLGPTNELQLKPELVAIGENVFSTLPTYQDSYGFRSGTSFSTPFITGSVALILSNLKNQPMDPVLVKTILMNFATQVKKPISDSPYVDSPIRQGAGVIDVVQAINGYEQFHVTPPVLSLNDSANFNDEQNITIYNHQSQDLNLTIEHLPSLTVTGYSLKEDNFSYIPAEPVGLYNRPNSVAELNSTSLIIIPAGKSIQVSLKIQPPVNQFKKEWHVLYGGYISIKSEKNTANVPYFGMIGNMKDLPIFDRSNNLAYEFPSIGLPSGLTLKSNETGEFHIYSKGEKIVGGPYILARLLTGTSILQFQILNQNNQYIGDIPMTEDNARQWMMRNTLKNTEYSKVYYSWYWSGEYITNGTRAYLQSGEYKLKLRGLHVFGDRENPDDWDEWISPNLKLHINL